MFVEKKILILLPSAETHWLDDDVFKLLSLGGHVLDRLAPLRSLPRHFPALGHPGDAIPVPPNLNHLVQPSHLAEGEGEGVGGSGREG